MGNGRLSLNSEGLWSPLSITWLCRLPGNIFSPFFLLLNHVSPKQRSMNISYPNCFANDRSIRLRNKYSVRDYLSVLAHSLGNYEITLFACLKLMEEWLNTLVLLFDLWHYAVLALCSNRYFHDRSKRSQVEPQMLSLASTKPNACMYYPTPTTLTRPSTLTINQVASKAVVCSRGWWSSHTSP